MFFYGIGHAIIDYFFQAENFPRLPEPVAEGKALHVDEGDFSRLLETLRGPPWFQDFSGKENREAGGAVFNALKAIRQFGGEAFFSGSYGKNPAPDSAALFFRKSAEKYGVPCDLALREKATGSCLIARTAGGQVVVASPGSAPLIQASQFDETQAKKADCIIIEGMQCANPALAEKITAFCGQENKALAILSATPYGAKQTRSLLSSKGEKFPALLVFANEDEGSFVREAALALPRLLYVETWGEKGGAVYLPAKAQREVSLFSGVTPEAPFLDATGAGDVFAGVFLAQWFSRAQAEESLGEVCAAAARAAAEVTTTALCRV